MVTKWCHHVGARPRCLWKEWITRTQTRDDTGRITLWLLLLDLDSESGSWVTASSVPSRSSPLPHSPVLSMELSLVCPGPCVQHQSWGANIYLYTVPWLRRNYPVMLMQHSSRGFVLLLLPAGFTWLHCFPRSILSLLLSWPPSTSTVYIYPDLQPRWYQTDALRKCLT